MKHLLPAAVIFMVAGYAAKDDDVRVPVLQAAPPPVQLRMMKRLPVAESVCSLMRRTAIPVRPSARLKLPDKVRPGI